MLCFRYLFLSLFAFVTVVGAILFLFLFVVFVFLFYCERNCRKVNCLRAIWTSLDGAAASVRRQRKCEKNCLLVIILQPVARQNCFVMVAIYSFVVCFQLLCYIWQENSAAFDGEHEKHKHMQIHTNTHDSIILYIHTCWSTCIYPKRLTHS